MDPAAAGPNPNVILEHASNMHGADAAEGFNALHHVKLAPSPACRELRTVFLRSQLLLPLR